MQNLKFIDRAVVKNSDTTTVKHMLFEMRMSKTHRKMTLLADKLSKTHRKIIISASQKPPGAAYLPAASQLFQRCLRDAQMPPRCLPEASSMTPLI
jgi:hypothetical protein